MLIILHEINPETFRLTHVHDKNYINTCSIRYTKNKYTSKPCIIV